MDSLDTIFRHFPKLPSALLQQNLLEEFDGPTLGRANAYADGKHISSLRLKEEVPGRGTIFAQVKGSRKKPLPSSDSLSHGKGFDRSCPGLLHLSG